ncbi:PREDICTED: receptor protein kinase-like protein ZAR1 [Ipomoea nil]|uniref:receptor protein kinase-like protein ZAR1 n=1 Tax=Ipomoea nil TaxID=35883 RepID=UPI00090180BE|nr:PREDICTED: receptor protein kinase-like protein ZAR1 [Ipomoea nil]
MRNFSGDSPFLGVIFFLAVGVSVSSALSSDGFSLLALKAAIVSDESQVLGSWSESDSSPCRWAGVTCDHNHRVTAVSLSNGNLTGYIPSELGALSALSSLSLAYNNFSDPIPANLFNASSLLSLDLSHNCFSGPLPPQIAALTNLTHLDLSSNFLNGSLPPELNALSNLAGTLNLSYNRFSGEVPASYGLFPVALSLDLRHNNLTGKIPAEGSLLNQGPTAFSGNPYLCGFPLATPCPDPEAQNPKAFPNPENPQNPDFSPNGHADRGKQRLRSATVSLISGVSIVIGVAFVSLWVFRKKWNLTEGKIRKETLGMTTEAPASEQGQKGKYIAVDEGFALELEDLLRASAYVVGKSRSGIVYKVVSGGGRATAASGGATVVAVRRLSEGDATWRFKEFEAEVEAIGRVHHPNILRLRAYYYASDEKLLVTDFICNGSLHNALHGGPGVSLPTLSWPARLKIAQGIARGLVHIHECSPKRYVHGNIKSSKILLDDELQPYVSGFGLTRLVSNASRLTSSASKKMNSSNQVTVSPRSSASPSLAYKAPEARVSGSKLTQKCDVYSFGVVLLEILTGRVPEGGPEEDGKGLEDTVRKVFQDERPLSEIIDPALLHEVQSKKQVVATFHIALNCTEFDPECRPRMRTVAESLERIGLQ